MRTSHIGAPAARRPARLAAATLTVLLLWALPAAAVGVAGVDLSVGLPTTEDGRPLLDLRAAEPEVEVRVRNTVDEVREVRLYAVGAEPTDDGSFALAGEGSASWLGLAEEVVELAAGETATRYAEVDLRGVPEEASHVAVVIETGTDSTLVTRAARVIELGEHEAAGLPLWLVLLALALLVLAVIAHVLRARGTGRGQDPTASAAATDTSTTREAAEPLPVT